MSEFAELREIAENATPGPWEWEPPSEESWPQEDESLVTFWTNDNGFPDDVLVGWGHDASGIGAETQDREFIATFNPARVLGLLDRLEQAEAAIARVREVHENMDGECWGCRPRYGADPYPCETIEALEGKSD